jgi:large subunit ribosomal protein L3
VKIFAKKIGMTHIFSGEGKMTPVTVLKLEKTCLCGLRLKAKDGYSANIFARIDSKFKTPKSVAGRYKSVENIRGLSEERISDDGGQSLKIGQIVDASYLKTGDVVAIEGRSKGKGFAGTVKRHSFTTGPKTHGSCNWRRPGSIGPTYPQRVIKGRNMAGHMGATKVLVKKAVVQRVSADQIWVSGSAPGPNKSVVLITKL